MTFVVLNKVARSAPLDGRANARDETCLALVADETAATHFLLWGAECDVFKPGDIFSYRRSNNLVLQADRRGRMEKVDEFTMLFVVTPNMSEPDAPGGLSSGSTVKLKDLVPAATNNVNTTFIVLDKMTRVAPPHSRDNVRDETCMALVADETAAVHFLLWGAECDAFEPGDIVRLIGGIFSYHMSNNLVLRAGRRGRTEKVGEFTMLFVETPNMSEVKWVRDPGDPRRMVQEAIVSSHSQPDALGVSGISSANTVNLRDLVPAATNNVNTMFIVLDKATRVAPPHDRDDTRDETCLSLVADEMVAAHFLLWGAECMAFEPGDIVWLTSGIFSYHKSNNLVLRAGRHGRTEKVGELTMLFIETPNMSKVKWARETLTTAGGWEVANAPPLHSRADTREETETCLALVADEMVKLTGGIFSYHRSNSLVLWAGWRGRMEKVGEFTMLFVETVNMSEVKWARDPRRMVQEAVVSPHSMVFKPLQ
uniref:Uncharacterized protein n=1 Tax=Oryza punctata TaxID=4537 RepID=A0A0E0LJZ4_ORYPU